MIAATTINERKWRIRPQFLPSVLLGRRVFAVLDQFHLHYAVYRQRAGFAQKMRVF